MLHPDFIPGSLDRLLTQTRQRALAHQALQPVSCELMIHWEQGIPFQIRTLPSLKDKQTALRRLERAGECRVNPFLPYDPQLLVTQLTDHRLVLLNKFYVVEDHALIVSAAFEDQRLPLGYEDFYALAVAMAEVPGLGFYNGGPQAGASQPHRHLQLVAESRLGQSFPISPTVLSNTKAMFLYRSISGLDKQIDRRVAQLLEFYRQSLDSLHLNLGGDGHLAPYNLLVGDDWAMMVPRSRAEVEGIPLNSLGYAGAFLAKDERQLEQIQSIGCLELLRRAAVPDQRPGG